MHSAPDQGSQKDEKGTGKRTCNIAAPDDTIVADKRACKFAVICKPNKDELLLWARKEQVSFGIKCDVRHSTLMTLQQKRPLKEKTSNYDVKRKY